MTVSKTSTSVVTTSNSTEESRFITELKFGISSIREQLSLAVDRYSSLLKEYDGTKDHETTLDMLSHNVRSLTLSLKASIKELDKLEDRTSFFDQFTHMFQ